MPPGRAECDQAGDSPTILPAAESTEHRHRSGLESSRPRHFFRTLNDIERGHSVGEKLPDPAVARQKAVFHARGLAAEAVGAGAIDLNHSLRIENKEDDHVTTITFRGVFSIKYRSRDIWIEFPQFAPIRLCWTRVRSGPLVTRRKATALFAMSTNPASSQSLSGLRLHIGATLALPGAGLSVSAWVTNLSCFEFTAMMAASPKAQAAVTLVMPSIGAFAAQVSRTVGTRLEANFVHPLSIEQLRAALRLAQPSTGSADFN